MSDKKGINRREFLGSTVAASAAAFTIVPRNVLGGPGFKAPSDQLNIAGIGIGGKGKHNLIECARVGENIVALCDVDEDYAGEAFKEFPDAKTYKDFRVMLEKQKDIDAVVIATPDHSHTVIALAAMELGKHAYVQKPLTRTVSEARLLTEAARKYKVATQMGNQGHSSDSVRRLTEWIEDGAIGKVREVHAWTDRPWWLHGIYRPHEKPDVPEKLDWDLWLGPAPYRPYHPHYLPWVWRGWWDYGTGALGDMGCHVLDVVFAALKLEPPSSVEACSPVMYAQRHCKKDTLSETAPVASIVRYQFPKRKKTPAVTLSWYDGGLMPPRPQELEPERKLGDNGLIFIGDKGTILTGIYGEGARIIPEKKMKKYKLPKETLPRIEGSHEQDWIQACKGGEPACANFDYSGPFTEIVLLGNVAIRAGEKIDWDAKNMKVTNNEKANQYITSTSRAGWGV